MAHNRNKYPEVERLPENAFTVQAYADEDSGDKKKCSVQWLYRQLQMLRNGKVSHIPFKMVTWQGHNYIVPQSTTNN